MTEWQTGDLPEDDAHLDAPVDGDPDEVDAADEGYDPDPDEDEQDVNILNPRGRALRRGVLQRRPTTVSQPRSLNRGGGRIIAREKQRQALELRKAGATYQDIANQLGYYDQSAARKAVMRAFGDVIQEPVTEVKALQIERLNHMLLALWGKVQTGDERAIGTALQIMTRMDALMGTESAKEVDVNVNHQGAVLIVDGDKDDFIKAAARMAGINPDGSNAVALPAGAPPTGVIDAEVVADPDPVPLPDTVPYVDTGDDTPPPPTYDFTIE